MPATEQQRQQLVEAFQVALEQGHAALRAGLRRLLGRQAEVPGTADG